MEDGIQPTVFQVMDFLKKDGDVSILSFNMILDRVIALDAGYAKFVMDVRALLDKRWKDHQENLLQIQAYQWPGDFTIYKWEEKYLRDESSAT